MITFFVRLGIILIVFFFIIIISIGFNINPFIIASVLMCSWIMVISFEKIFWWIIIFATIFGLLYYDVFGFFTIGIILITFLFHLIHEQSIRSANNVPIVLYGVAFLLSVVVINILEFILQHHIFLNLHMFVINIIVTLPLFFLFYFSIIRAERFIDLYTHGTDMRCHT